MMRARPTICTMMMPLALGMLGFWAATGVALAETADAERFRSRLGAAQAQLAMNLMQRLAAPEKRVVTVSPASLAGAAAALDLGASPRMRGALHGMLGFRKDADAAADLDALRMRLAGLRDAGGPSVQIHALTSAVFDDGVKLYPGVGLAFQQAGIEHVVTDLRAPGATEAINKRVRDATAGMIPEIIDNLASETRLVVVNALYFKAPWKLPFDKAETKPAPFREAGGAAAFASMMHLPRGEYAFRRDVRFVAIDLPYGDERFRMTIVTSQGERPEPLRRFRAAAEWLSGEGFSRLEGELALPRFDLSSQEELTPVVDRLGLRGARLSAGALAGFSPDGATISRLVQRIELRVEEEGTQAAAATAAVMERGGTEEYVRMVVDRPFIFALRDTRSGLMLAAGYVGRPTTLAAASR
jgi:serine protease inhibitor